MKEWFYARGGQQSGPVTFDQLKALARTGELDAKDLVWTSSMKDWQPAGQVEGIFQTSTGTDAPPADPSNPYAAPQSAWNEPAPAAGAGLAEITPGSDPIDVGACVKRGFELTKRNFGTILLIGLAYFGVSIAASLVLGGIDSALGFGSTHTQWQTGGLFTAILGNVLSVLLSLGLVRIGLNFVSGKQVSVGQLFGEGRKLLTISPLILLGVITNVSMLYFNPSPFMGTPWMVAVVLLIVPGIYLTLRCGQFMNAIVDRNLGMLDSLKYSWSITTHNCLNLFLLGLLSIAIVIAGLIALVVGLIFAYPVVWLSWMVAFRWMQYGQRAVQDHPGTTTPLLGSL